MGCLFQLFKLVYVGLVAFILVINIDYIYKYVKMLDTERFFQDNQFAHFMGIFLGFLFRVSGLLSAMKEKISLTATYGLFLVLIVLLHSTVDQVFYIYVSTTVYAFLYVIVLKYRRSKQHRKQMRGGGGAHHNTRTVLLNQSGSGGGRSGRRGRDSRTNNAQLTLPSNMMAVDLNSSTTTIMPSAPPYEVGQPNNLPILSPNVLTVALSPTTTTMPNAPPLSTAINMGQNPNIDAAYLHQLQHTPPPSYSEIYQTK